jgi:hypothetical protein
MRHRLLRLVFHRRLILSCYTQDIFWRWP